MKENVTNRYGFTGQMRDGITGQYYMRVRYYVPEIGRFTQADTPTGSHRVFINLAPKAGKTNRNSQFPYYGGDK